MPPSGAGTGPRRAGLQPWGRRFAVRYRVEVDVRHRPVETLRLVREAERQCDGDVGGDHTEVPRGDLEAFLVQYPTEMNRMLQTQARRLQNATQWRS